MQLKWTTRLDVVAVLTLLFLSSLSAVRGVEQHRSRHNHQHTDDPSETGELADGEDFLHTSQQQQQPRPTPGYDTYPEVLPEDEEGRDIENVSAIGHGNFNSDVDSHASSPLSSGNDVVRDMATPFFLIATVLFIVALVYSIIFLCVMRFGTFQPAYNARFFRGRIYFCVGNEFWSRIFRCYIPICWCVRLHPVSEEQAFARALEGGGLSREERREALLEVLKPMCHSVDEHLADSVASCDDDENESDDDDSCKTNGTSKLISTVAIVEEGKDEDKVIHTDLREEEDDDYAESDLESFKEDDLATVVHDPTCSICLSTYEEGETCLISNCCHRFHFDCVVEWLEVNNNTACPNCRVDMITNEQVKETAKRLRREKCRKSKSGARGLLSSFRDRTKVFFKVLVFNRRDEININDNEEEDEAGGAVQNDVDDSNDIDESMPVLPHVVNSSNNGVSLRQGGALPVGVERPHQRMTDLEHGCEDH